LNIKNSPPYAFEGGVARQATAWRDGVVAMINRDIRKEWLISHKRKFVLYHLVSSLCSLPLRETSHRLLQLGGELYYVQKRKLKNLQSSYKYFIFILFPDCP
jgi:hypothetical protein